MEPLHRSRLVVVLAAVVVAVFANTWDAHPDRGNRQVAQLTEKMKTVCVGRFLIDLPMETAVELSSARIQGFQLAAFEESVDEFQTRLAQREAEVGAQPDKDGGNKNLELVREIKTSSGLVGKILVHSRRVTVGTAGNGVEMEHYRYEGIAVEGLVHGNGVSIDLGSDYYSLDKLENLYRLVNQLVPNLQNDIPHEPGFCLDRAYVRDPLAADQREQVTMFATLPSHPDIDFMLILAAGVKPSEDGLLKRGGVAEAELPLTERFRISRLRAAPRQIHGLLGEELVRRGIEANNAQVYSFWWEVNGRRDDVLTPHLEFTMTTGKSSKGPVQPSMSQDAALEFWDRVLSSIRANPIHQSKQSAAL